MVDIGSWVVGTPDDLIKYIKELDHDTGGFGGLMIQATEWGTREQVMHSYELIARYVMPHFQGSLTNLEASYQWGVDNVANIEEKRRVAVNKAIDDYEKTQ